jgi:flagellar basal body-associated protein FliL
MKNNKILIAIVIVLLIAIVTITGVIASNFTHKAAEPASASGTYIQNTTTEEEQSNCCGN